MIKKLTCSGCKKLKFIQNKTSQLCSECAYIKNHGKTRFDVIVEKHRIYQQRRKDQSRAIIIIKKHKKRRYIRTSAKQNEINIKYKLVCEKIDNEREQLCAGCGSSQHLSHSHIISRKDCKSLDRVDLITDEQNITYHCMNSCHQKWESKRKKIMLTLLDFNKNINYIKSISKELYNIIINR